jgi:tetratricopeptide (TPR) repeat protein
MLLVLSMSAVACGPGRGRYGQPVHHAERVTVAGSEVSDDAFAGAVRDLLASEPGSRERSLRLQGVIGRQMTRVATRFKARDRDRAIASLTGAMYLVHAGELTKDVLGPHGYEALHSASDELSKKGDEGRARAVYEMLFRLSNSPQEKNDIKSHLDAIGAWTKDTAGGGPMQIAGGLETAAVTRHLLEPSTEARDEAIVRTREFVEKALALRAARHARGTQVSREEAAEAVRAIDTGATIIAAIHLRSADPQGAIKAIDGANFREITRPELMNALNAVVEHPDPDKWLDLARMLRPPPRQQLRGSEDEDFSRDIELLRLASFVAACEAYRLDATLAEPAAYVGALLVDLGMGEAAPAIMADAVKANKDPRFVSLGLALTMQAMGRALEAEEPDEVRRTFRAAEPILAAADAVKKNVQPSPARVYAMMGGIELGEGRLEDARKYLTQADEREKSGGVTLSLARLDWHDEKTKSALDRLRNALALEDVQRDPALRGEVLLTISDITREGGDMSAARKPLGDALRDLAKARGAAEGDDRARIERLISRALDRFGAGSSALKALERALEASPRDKRQTAATVGMIVGRAFVKGDLPGARDGLSRGLSAELGREDIVYYALWVRILEKQLRATSDGAAERVLAQASDDPRWIGRIAAFGAGKINASQLTAAAQTPTQKTEALFYSAMDRKIAGDSKGADDGLKQVVSSPGLDLLEYALAREILNGQRAQVGGPVPEVGLP